jgi:hypothetical protein
VAVAYKRKLSGSTDGKPVLVVAITTAGTTVHTAVAGTTPGTFAETWLWPYNGNTSAVVLTIEFGGADVPDQNIVLTLAAQAGLVPILPGLILQNGMVVKAFASVANKVTLSGFVNAITD